MKFFTLKSYFEDDLVTTGEGWREHVEQMREILPESLIRFMDQDLVDDGLIVQVDHNREAQKLVLKMRCGNLQVGYYDLVITYKQAIITPDHDITLASIARSQEYNVEVHREDGTSYFAKSNWYDVFAHELDITSEGYYEHRILFNPGVWFAITCKNLTWKQIPRKGSRFVHLSERYPNAPRCN